MYLGVVTYVFFALVPFGLILGSNIVFLFKLREHRKSKNRIKKTVTSNTVISGRGSRTTEAEMSPIKTHNEDKPKNDASRSSQVTEATLDADMDLGFSDFLKGSDF